MVGLVAGDAVAVDAGRGVVAGADPRLAVFGDEEPGGGGGDAERCRAGVGAAVTQVLETYGARLHMLAPQEVVAVAIDFVPATRMGVPARTARTLTVRARKVDIDQRAAGQITPEEFRKRVELVEY